MLGRQVPAVPPPPPARCAIPLWERVLPFLMKGGGHVEMTQPLWSLSASVGWVWCQGMSAWWALRKGRGLASSALSLLQSLEAVHSLGLPVPQVPYRDPFWAPRGHLPFSPLLP